MSKAQEAPGRRRFLWIVLCLLGTTGGFAYILATADLRQVLAATARTPWWLMAVALVLSGLMLFMVAARWRMVLRAYGAPGRPSLLRLTHLYAVGLFYNTFFPGGVGGDLVRGMTSREAFGSDSATPALIVVFIERVLGMGALLAMVVISLAIRPLPMVQNALTWSGLGLGVAVLTIFGVAGARRLTWLPGRLGKIAADVPAVAWLPGLPMGLLFSVGAQCLFVGAGYLLLSSVAPQVTLVDAMVVIPVAMAAAFFPLTVGGAGVREAALVIVCTTTLQVPASDAAAASLMIWFCQLVVASFGGAVQLLLPFQRGGEGRSD